jgi:hypothetical protein
MQLSLGQMASKNKTQLDFIVGNIILVSLNLLDIIDIDATLELWTGSIVPINSEGNGIE